MNRTMWLQLHNFICHSSSEQNREHLKSVVSSAEPTSSHHCLLQCTVSDCLRLFSCLRYLPCTLLCDVMVFNQYTNDSIGCPIISQHSTTVGAFIFLCTIEQIITLYLWEFIFNCHLTKKRVGKNKPLLGIGIKRIFFTFVVYSIQVPKRGTCTLIQSCRIGDEKEMQMQNEQAHCPINYKWNLTDIN